jgi:hypothetical protein
MGDISDYIDRSVLRLLDENIEEQIKLEEHFNKNIDYFRLNIYKMKKFFWKKDFNEFNDMIIKKLCLMKPSLDFNVEDEFRNQTKKVKNKNNIIYWRFIDRKKRGLGN